MIREPGMFRLSGTHSIGFVLGIFLMYHPFGHPVVERDLRTIRRSPLGCGASFKDEDDTERAQCTAATSFARPEYSDGLRTSVRDSLRTGGGHKH